MRKIRLCVLAVVFALFCGCAVPETPVSPYQPTMLIAMPQTRQATSYTCGVAVLQSILGHNGILYRQDVLEEKVGATEEHGTNPHAMTALLREHGIGAVIEENMSLERLRAHIASGRPVVCFLQAWNGDPAFDYSNGWEDGHYAIAIGFDAERIYFMDPSTLGTYAYIDNAPFLLRWHDGDENHQVRQTGIVVTNPHPTYSRTAFTPML